VMFEEQFNTRDWVAVLTVTLADAELLPLLRSVGVELVMVAVLRKAPELVACTVMVKVETVLVGPGEKLQIPLEGVYVPGPDEVT
jgi:hypothetical protein